MCRHGNYEQNWTWRTAKEPSSPNGTNDETVSILLFFSFLPVSFLSYMNLFSLGLVGECQLFTHHLVRFSSNAIQVTGGELPWLIWGDDTHITCSSTVFTYLNFLYSCSFGCWNCMLIKSSFTIFLIIFGYFRPENLHTLICLCFKPRQVTKVGVLH